ncbi:MAG: hypothetical protein K0R51_797 [Cytophagaceae bacterium]|jgi:rhamnogalacturonyl hydrolase YesR|nr:hypothetical protein [Cytophagaceae bacterium]
MKTKRIILFLLFAFSLALNVMVLSMDTVPFLWPKVARKLDKEDKHILAPDVLEQKVVSKALEMAKSDQVTAVWKDHRGITETVFDFAREGDNSAFKKYNYPRAFLYYGLSEYYLKQDGQKSMDEFKTIFDQLLDAQGKALFDLDKVDQAPFGLAALNLYRIYKEQKYMHFADLIYDQIVIHRNQQGLVLYRADATNQLNDLLGMIVPFLVEYNKLKPGTNALSIAKAQLDFFIRYGVDPLTFIPAHGIDLKSKIKTGSSNWGRGIGWYLLGLSFYHQATLGYQKEVDGIFNSLHAVKNPEALWSQFPGSTDQFDASATTLFMVSFSKVNSKLFSSEQALNLLSKYIDSNGALMQTSGDTYGLNAYSKTFGESELSQGMLVLLLANRNK